MLAHDGRKISQNVASQTFSWCDKLIIIIIIIIIIVMGTEQTSKNMLMKVQQFSICDVKLSFKNFATAV